MNTETETPIQRSQRRYWVTDLSGIPDVPADKRGLLHRCTGYRMTVCGEETSILVTRRTLKEVRSHADRCPECWSGVADLVAVQTDPSTQVEP